MSPTTAEVQVLTAEVRVLMVGSRQVTLSVYRQLDRVNPSECEPFGRVNDAHDDSAYVDCTYVVGRHTVTGVLVRSRQRDPGTTPLYEFDTADEARSWAVTRGLVFPERPYRQRTPLCVPVLKNDVAHLHAALPWPCDFRGSNEEGWRPDWRPDTQTWLQDEQRYVPTPDVTPLSDEVIDEIDRDLTDHLANHTTTIMRYRNWQALPLIVLAGLR